MQRSSVKVLRGGRVVIKAVACVTCFCVSVAPSLLLLRLARLGDKAW